jgi:hypothetical protein
MNVRNRKARVPVCVYRNNVQRCVVGERQERQEKYNKKISRLKDKN